MNEPAFPTGTGITPYKSGMTLRDYFAAKAMQGAIAHGLFNADKTSLDYSEYIANIAYVYADAMLKARQE
jgi:hypothetical protein